MRLELFFKTTPQLISAVQYGIGAGFTKFNLANKDKKDTTIDWGKRILACSSNNDASSSNNDANGDLDVSTDLDVCTHYSLKNNIATDKETMFNHFVNYLHTASDGNIREVLVVSGSKKPKLDTVQCLEKLTVQDKRGVKLGIAYNPYFPETEDQAKENHRLAQKLSTQMVDSVWIQIGCDLDKLKQGIGYRV